MIRRILATFVVAAVLLVANSGSAEAQQQGYGAVWGGGQQSMNNLDRFYHYPYVYYPHNFYSNNYYRSSDSLYHRYPQEMRVPVYNRSWHNEYPSPRRYHWGHHFITDVF
jgi:hypothetical protein